VTEYLREIGNTGRRLAIWGLGLTAAASAAVNLAEVVAPMDPRARAEIPGTLFATGLVFGCLTFASVWMLLRLLRKGRSSNQVDDACLVHPNIWIALRGRDWFRSARGRPEAVPGRGASGGAEYGVSSKTAATEIVRRASQLTRDPAALSRFGPT
jgi:hypothetical protein